MKRYLALFAFLAFFSVGCCRLPVCARMVWFYRDSDVNNGRPCAVDVIYPKDLAERDKIIEIGPQKWFTSDMYDHVHKDKVWLDNDVKSVALVNKAADDPYMIIFAEFTTPDPSPARGREAYIWYAKDRQPKSGKTEFIAVHNGSLERLDGKPSGRR